MNWDTEALEKLFGRGKRDTFLIYETYYKEDGKWKIYNQVVHDVKYLN
jgi:hypothetical protein